MTAVRKTVIRMVILDRLLKYLYFDASMSPPDFSTRHWSAYSSPRLAELYHSGDLGTDAASFLDRLISTGMPSSNDRFLRQALLALSVSFFKSLLAQEPLLHASHLSAPPI